MLDLSTDFYITFSIFLIFNFVVYLIEICSYTVFNGFLRFPMFVVLYIIRKVGQFFLNLIVSLNDSTDWTSYILNNN